MKISIIMGRGIEGCGVSKFTIEQTKWLEKHGHEVHVFAAKDKSWSRRTSHEMPTNTHILKFAKIDEITNVVEGCNSSDLVFINSVPSKGHSEACIENYKWALTQIKAPMIFMQHDHAALSIRRNAALEESVRASKLVLAHATTNDFSRIIGEFGIEELNLDTFQPGMNFDEVRNKYWKDVEIHDTKHNLWGGRCTSWKGYRQMFAFHNNYLRPNGYVTSMHGIERSPAYLDFRNLSEFHPYIHEKPENVEMLPNEPAYVFGPYVHAELLERMSTVAFSYQLSVLKEKYIYRSIEYTHCEAASVGTIPVFRKEYGDRCTHRSFGKPLTKCENTGTLWFDEENMQDNFNTLEKLANDSVMRNEWREMAFEFYKLHQDSDYVFVELMEKVNNAIK